MTQGDKSPATKARLLDAAGEIFVRRGFQNARVREICSQAGANVAAVNYHFRDKQGLYEAVLAHAFFRVTGEDPTDWGVSRDADAGQFLQGLVRTLLHQLLSEGKSARLLKLVAREMVDPTPAIKHVIEEGIRPQVNILLTALRKLAKSGVSDRQLRRCAASIFGQCLFYYFCRPAVQQIPFEEKIGPETVEALAKHITEFSLAGLGGIAPHRKTAPRGRGKRSSPK